MGIQQPGFCHKSKTGTCWGHRLRGSIGEEKPDREAGLLKSIITVGEHQLLSGGRGGGGGMRRV